MPDINATEVGLPVFVADGTSSEKAAVLTTTPSAADAGLVVREAQRGQGTMAASIPVVIASNQSAVTTNDNKTEDAAHASGDVGSFVLAVRNDAGTTLVGTDGDYAPLQVDSTGALRIAGNFNATVGDNKDEDDPHTSGDVGSFVLGVRNDAAAALTSSDGDYSAFATDSAGRVGVSDLGGSISVDDNAGSLTVDDGGSSISVDDNGGSLTVDGTVAVSSVGGTVTIVDGGGSITIDGTVAVSGTVTTGDNKTEDAAHASGDVGSFILVVRNDAATSLTSADGDYSAIAADSAGRIGISDLGGSISIDDNGATISIDDGAGSITVDGTVAVSSVGGSVTIVDGGGSISIDDNGTTISIDDGAGSITVDGTVAVSSVGGSVTVVDGGGSLTVDGTVTADTNFDFAEDAAHSSGDQGAFVLGVRNDAAAARTSTDGDYSPISTDSAGRVGISDLGGSISIDDNGGNISIDDGGNSITVDDGGGSLTVDDNKLEDAAHASGDAGSFVLAVRNDTFATSFTSTNGDYSPIAVDTNGRVFTGDNKAEDAAHASGDIGSFVLAVRNDTFATSFGANGDYSPIAVDANGRVFTGDNKIEDAAHASGDAGSFVLGVRNDAAASLTSTDGDYSPIAVDSAGRTLVAQPTASVLNAQVVGNVAHDAADSGNPVKIGGVARTTNPTAVADGDRVNASYDKLGRQVVTVSQARDLVTSSYTELTNTTETTILAAGGAGVFHDISTLVIQYTHTSARVVVTIRDTTGGATIMKFRLSGEPSDAVSVNFVVPLPQTTANSNWTAQAATSPSSVVAITVVAIKNT